MNIKIEIKWQVRKVQKAKRKLMIQNQTNQRVRAKINLLQKLTKSKNKVRRQNQRNKPTKKNQRSQSLMINQMYQQFFHPQRKILYKKK